MGTYTALDGVVLLGYSPRRREMQVLSLIVQMIRVMLNYRIMKMIPCFLLLWTQCGAEQEVFPGKGTKFSGSHA